MIEARRVYDQPTISKVLDHPKNRRAVGRDEPVGLNWPIMVEIIYLGIFYKSECVGLFVGTYKNPILLDTHVAMLPNGYKYTDQAYQAAIDWVRENTDIEKLVGETPIFNRLAVAANVRNGFAKEGINRRSILKNGQLFDSIYFGLILRE